MSEGTKELTELLRAGSAILIQYLTSIEDGEFGFFDKVKMVGLYPEISAGIKGVSGIVVELKDLDPNEKDDLIFEIKDALLKTGMFSHREADIAEKILSLVYINVVGIADILKLPPTAELIQ